MTDKHFGYLLDPSDTRDRDYAMALTAEEFAPEILSMVDNVAEVLDQGPVGSCVLHGGFGAVRVKHSVDGVQNPDLGARSVGYNLLRGYIGTETEDSGGYIRDFFKGVNRYGFAREKDYPYKPRELAAYFADPDRRSKPPPDKPPPEFFRDSFDQKEPAVYSRISSTGAARIAEFKAAINARQPIVGGAMLGWDFLDWNGSIGIACPLTTGGQAGGHAFYGVGYNPIGLVCVNSWGVRWGEGGLFTVSWNDAARGTVDDLIDVWVVERAPYYSQEAAA